MRFAVVNSENEVINVIEWDGIADFPLPVELKLIKSNHANIGDFYDESTGDFLNKSPSEDE